MSENKACVPREEKIYLVLLQLKCFIACACMKKKWNNALHYRNKVKAIPDAEKILQDMKYAVKFTVLAIYLCVYVYYYEEK